jgi:hypothetical protein
MGVFSAVGPTLNAIGGLGGAIIKAGVHGVIGGALSVAQGGSFLQGFAGSAAGALGGYLAGESGFAGKYGDGDSGNILARALISGAAGCAGAAVSGGKCAQAAVTAAFGSLYNGETGRVVGGGVGALAGSAAGTGLTGACAYFTAGLCAGAGPYLTAGGAWLGRYGGAIAGSAIEDWAASAWSKDDAGASTAANDNARIHNNSASSREPTELYHLINRSTGVIDKIGITMNPAARYDQAYLESQNVRYVTQYQFQTRAPAMLAEFVELRVYRTVYGQYPRLNFNGR